MLTKIEDLGSRAIVHTEYVDHISLSESERVTEASTYVAHGHYIYHELPSGRLGDQVCEGLALRGPTMMAHKDETVGAAIARSLEAVHGYRPDLETLA